MHLVCTSSIIRNCAKKKTNVIVVEELLGLFWFFPRAKTAPLLGLRAWPGLGLARATYAGLRHARVLPAEQAAMHSAGLLPPASAQRQLHVGRSVPRPTAIPLAEHLRGRSSQQRQRVASTTAVATGGCCCRWERHGHRDGARWLAAGAGRGCTGGGPSALLAGIAGAAADLR